MMEIMAAGFGATRVTMIPPLFFCDFINMPTGAVSIVYVFMEGICAIAIICHLSRG